MAQLHYAPTKTNLLRLRNDLNFAQQGYELLDQKRNILIIELLALVDQTVDFQSRVETALAKAYKALEETVFDMGKLKVQYLTGAVNISTDITVRSRRVMGVTLPVIETEFKEHSPYYSPMGTSFWIDSSSTDQNPFATSLLSIQKKRWSGSSVSESFAVSLSPIM